MIIQALKIKFLRQYYQCVRHSQYAPGKFFISANQSDSLNIKWLKTSWQMANLTYYCMSKSALDTLTKCLAQGWNNFSCQSLCCSLISFIIWRISFKRCPSQQCQVNKSHIYKYWFKWINFEQIAARPVLTHQWFLHVLNRADQSQLKK